MNRGPRSSRCRNPAPVVRQGHSPHHTRFAGNIFYHRFVISRSLQTAEIQTTIDLLESTSANSTSADKLGAVSCSAGPISDPMTCSAPPISRSPRGVHCCPQPLRCPNNNWKKLEHPRLMSAYLKWQLITLKVFTLVRADVYDVALITAEARLLPLSLDGTVKTAQGGSGLGS
jgi:hypothetical protein